MLTYNSRRGNIIVSSRDDENKTRKRGNKLLFKLSFNGKEATIEADGLSDAEYKAYKTYGEDAIGLAVQGDSNNFSFTVAKDVWEMVLKEYFPKFSMADVLNHLMVVNYAWLNFDKVKSYDYYEDCEVTRLSEDGLKYIHENDKLSVEMDRIGFEW